MMGGFGRISNAIDEQHSLQSLKADVFIEGI